MHTIRDEASGGADVLVQVKDILRIVPTLKCLETLVPLLAIRLAHTLLSLLHQPVHVDAGMVRSEGGPAGACPITLLLEPIR